ncbi:hypothetical protein [Sphingomonas sp.]
MTTETISTAANDAVETAENKLSKATEAASKKLAEAGEATSKAATAAKEKISAATETTVDSAKKHPVAAAAIVAGTAAAVAGAAFGVSKLIEKNQQPKKAGSTGVKTGNAKTGANKSTR